MKKRQSNRKYYFDGDLLFIQCGKCGCIKAIGEFGKKHNSMFGICEICKECRKEEYNLNKDKILQSRKEYYNKNSDKKKEYQNNYYRNNSEHIKQQHKEYRKENCNIIKKKEKDNYLKNKEYISGRNEEYSKNKTIEVGFGWRKFHDKASRYARVHNLNPDKCSVCGELKRIVLHHPSYESFDKRKDVVFVCDSCHQNIHLGLVNCPDSIDLVILHECNGKR